MVALLTSWLQLWPVDPGYQVIELFAGQARVCKLATAIGLANCAHDVTYDETVLQESAFNINSNSGFLQLGW